MPVKEVREQLHRPSGHKIGLTPFDGSERLVGYQELHSICTACSFGRQKSSWVQFDDDCEYW